MKTETAVTGGDAPRYVAPQSCVRILMCGYVFAGSNTGETFVQEEDYDGF